MTKRTRRDEIWHCALQCALTGERFKLDRIQKMITSEVSRRTVRDVLNTMVEYDWLSKEKPQSHEWFSGPHLPTDQLSLEDQPVPSSPEPSPHTHVSSAGSLNKGTVYTASVDRFSSSGNAIVSIQNEQFSRNHINLGPLDRKAKNQSVLFEFMGGVWGMCLNEEYTDEQYRPRQNQPGSTDSFPSSNGDLESIAQGVSTTTRQNRDRKRSTSDDWERRKQEYLKDVNETYD